MKEQPVIIFCEGASDQRMISIVLRSLGQQAHVELSVQNRPLSPQMLRTNLNEFEDRDRRGGASGKLRRIARDFEKAIIVFDLDFGSPIDPAPSHSEIDGLWLAAAVPTVDSWILSDPTVYSNLSRTTPDLPVYDEFIRTSGVWFINERIKRALTTKKVAAEYSHLRAAMLSPSLRSFIKLLRPETVSGDLSFESQPPASVVLSRLLEESYPPTLPVYRTLDGQVFTGGQMVSEIISGTEIGRKYGSDLLRVSRDLLMRQANKRSVS